jgi:AraC family transcriptional regulator, regulatory protein of adaptative response / methylated-DNA-[protein]-cysteine methyltransferase
MTNTSYYLAHNSRTAIKRKNRVLKGPHIFYFYSTKQLAMTTQTNLTKSLVQEIVSSTNLKAPISSLHLIKWTSADDGLPINWQLATTSIGEIVIASTLKGVCFVGFGAEKRKFSLSELKLKFPASALTEQSDKWQKEAIERIDHPELDLPVHLHLKGSEFQLKIWEKIARIPPGGLATYGLLAEDPRAARAVGTAVGANPVCVIIPCHRVVRSDGNIEGYHYGNEIKERLLKKEMTPPSGS